MTGWRRSVLATFMLLGSLIVFSPIFCVTQTTTIANAPGTEETWCDSIAAGVTGISMPDWLEYAAVIGGGIFALVWARRGKR